MGAGLDTGASGRGYHGGMKNAHLASLRGAVAVMSLVCVAGAARAQSAAQLWANNCANCHGERGQGGGAGTKSLLTGEYQFGGEHRDLFNSIKDGHPEDGMEAFGKTMNDVQIWGLVVHIRELQARANKDRLRAKDGVFTTKHHSYKVEQVYSDGLDVPWSVDWLPGAAGERPMLVTNRDGSMLRVENGKGVKISGMPKVFENGQGGLMDVAVHPQYAANGWIYLAFSDPMGEGRGAKGFTRIVRGKLAEADGAWAWTAQEDIWKAKPEHYVTGGLHFGCRIVFSKPQENGKRYVYWSLGERGRAETSQDMSRPNGKAFRLWDDGSVPTDNPFIERSDVYPAMYSLGHRNPQGMVVDDAGSVWVTEHGPRGGDELNKVEAGRNYGWPLVSFGLEYSGMPTRMPYPDLLKEQPKEGGPIAMPAYVWLPSIAASGLDIVRGEAFSAWKGDFVAGGLAGQCVDRIRVVDGVVTEHERLLSGGGRVRDVAVGPDGFVYVVLNDPDRVVRLVPAK